MDKIGLLFIRLPTAAALFPLNLQISCQFRAFLSLSYVQGHSCHHFQGLRCFRMQSILIILFTRKLTDYCSSAKLGDFNYFTAEKHPNLKNCQVYWFTLSLLHTTDRKDPSTKSVAYRKDYVIIDCYQVYRIMLFLL